MRGQGVDSLQKGSHMSSLESPGPSGYSAHRNSVLLVSEDSNESHNEGLFRLQPLSRLPRFNQAHNGLC